MGESMSFNFRGLFFQSSSEWGGVANDNPLIIFVGNVLTYFRYRTSRLCLNNTDIFHLRINIRHKVQKI